MQPEKSDTEYSVYQDGIYHTKTEILTPNIVHNYPHYNHKREYLLEYLPPVQKVDTRVIILGSNGMLGSYVYAVYNGCQAYEGNVIGLTRADFNFGQEPAVVENYLLNLITKGDLVINCIGMTNKRGCKTAEEELQFWRVNAVLPRLLAEAVRKNKGYLIHITTDCVFDGKEGWMCRLDPHTSMDVYGLSKSLGDCSIRGYPMVATIRCSIIGEEENGRSLVEWVLGSGSEIAKEPNIIKGYTNHTWNGITCFKLAAILLMAVRAPQHTLSELGYNDLFFGKENVIRSNRVTKCELIKTIAEVYGVNVIVEPTECEVEKHMELSATISCKETIREQIIAMREVDILNRRRVVKLTEVAQ